MDKNFTIDLESSMNSAQGLLTFMTDASKQIKTYLDEDVKKETKKKQQKRRRQLLHQLNNLNIRIPSIDIQLEKYKPDNFSAFSTNQESPSSFSPSFDSMASSSDEEAFNFSSCCYSNGRKRKLTNACKQDTIKKTKKNNSVSQTNKAFISMPSFHCSKTECNYPDNYIIPSPTPDFDDLVSCLLTDDLTAPPIDFESYLTRITT